MNKLLGCLLIWLVGALIAPVQAEFEVIQKCQDRDGTWHYGTYAARECTKGRVSVLSPRGIVIDQKESPDVMMELSEQERQSVLAVQRKQAALKKRVAEDQFFLSRYSDEAAVVSERDRKLAERDSAISTAKKIQADLNRGVATLREREQTEVNIAAIAEREQSIGQYEQEISRYQAEQQAIRAEYTQKISRFKEALSRANDVQE